MRICSLIFSTHSIQVNIFFKAESLFARYNSFFAPCQSRHQWKTGNPPSERSIQGEFTYQWLFPELWVPGACGGQPSSWNNNQFSPGSCSALGQSTDRGPGVTYQNIPRLQLKLTHHWVKFVLPSCFSNVVLVWRPGGLGLHRELLRPSELQTLVPEHGGERQTAHVPTPSLSLACAHSRHLCQLMDEHPLHSS